MLQSPGHDQASSSIHRELVFIGPVHSSSVLLLQMVHTFSGCVLGSAVECELDELLATRLVSFLMDHQHTILSVPEYLLTAVTDHVQYLRSAQVNAHSLIIY